jgi:succinoglycan biosynthesis transport protein ExoP
VTPEIAHLRRALAAVLKPTAAARKPVFVCVVSCRPGEGRTFLTEIFANALASSGQAVAFFDFSTEALASNSSAGRSEAPPAIRRKTPGDSGLDEGIDSLTFENGMNLWMDLRRLSVEGSGSAREVLSRYDVILLDVPPLGTAIEVRALAEAVDAVVFAVEWGRTDQDLVAAVLASSPSFRKKISGAVLTKVSPSQMRKYDPGSAFAIGVDRV